MSVEKDLIARIRQLEEQNSALQDKLDMIYAILAPDYDEGTEDDAAELESNAPNLIQIDGGGSATS
ncbi:MAG: hypothetical protein M3N54_00970 [Acidobacteriota bacterium]|nr:hypothetical protein [Acidobacteriota bacterium]